MDIEKIKSVLDQVKSLGIPKVNFFGGEPLVFGEKIVELVRYASRKGISVSIDTNGILLTAGLAKDLKQAGIDNINISLDSADRHIHDDLRGFSGAYDNALRAVNSCVKEGITCVISTYASKRAIYSKDLQRIIDIGRRYKVGAVKILLPLMSGKWSKRNDELLGEKEKALVYKLLDPGFVYLESPLYSMKKGKKVCEALDKKMIYISPSGDLQACYAVPVSFGNINAEPIKGIMARMWKSKLFEEVDNDYECIMNNPRFRKDYFKKVDDCNNFPVCQEEFFK
jgi:MoaA/NifB/PqqE/SkfB family radical SAM enzyme